MKMNKILAIGALTLSMAANAQLTTPQPSPTATLTQKVGLTDVEIVYSRPGAKGRTVFGDIVPYGEMWRTGANASTKLQVSTDVKIGGLDVPKGKYSLFTIPGKDEWTVIVNKDITLSGTDGYDQANDLGRFVVKSTKLNDMVETYTMDFSDFTTSTANLNLTWEKTKISLPIVTPADELVLKQIEKVMEGPSGGDYYQAARFYLEKEMKMDDALMYINKAIEKRPEAFWYIHVQAKIYAKLGKKKEAIASAEKSMALAKANADGDYGYIVSNEKLIKEIKEMK